MATVLSASNISKSFGKQLAVNNASIRVRKGEILGLLGPNGAGKTTLAKVLVGLVKPDTGKISYFGQEVKFGLGRAKKLIAMVPQEPSFFSSFTVKENIKFFASLYGLGSKEANNRANSLIKWLNLNEFSATKAEFLSGGYKRLLNIACSLVNSPWIIFLDEPTVGLDPKMRQLMWDKISALRETGTTVLLTTHYMDEAEELCDRVAMMSKGRIAVVDTPQKLISKHGGQTILIFKLNKNVELELIVNVKKVVPKTVVRCVQSTLILPVRQAETTKAIVRISKAIEEAGYEIKGSTVKEPELEDVFLSLTGKTIRE